MPKRDPLMVTLTAYGLPGGTSVNVTVTAPARWDDPTGHRRAVGYLVEDATRALEAACGGQVEAVPPVRSVTVEEATR